MDLLESLNHAFETLFEDVESRMHHLLQILLGKKSAWPYKDQPDAEEKAKNLLREVSQYDPTQGKNYMQFLTKQIAASGIRLPEDGPLLKETLEKFMEYSRKAAWKQPKDIMQYPHWRELQKAIGEYEKSPAFMFRVSSQAKATENLLAVKAKEGVELIVDIDAKTFSGLTNFKVWQCRTPIAVSMFGKGTQWCTSWMNDGNIYKTVKPQEVEAAITSLAQNRDFGYRGAVEGNPWANLTPESARQIVMDLNNGDLSKKEVKIPNPDRLNSSLSTAKNYLEGGPMYIIYKNDAPYIQLTHDGSQIMNVEDSRLKTISSALAVVLKEMMGVPQSPEAEKAISRKVQKTGKVSSALTKRLTEEIRRSEAAKAKALQQQQQQQKPPTPPVQPQ